MSMSDDKVYFGSVDGELVPWGPDPAEDDDEELAKTPQDVVDLLGFDPLELGD